MSKPCILAIAKLLPPQMEQLTSQFDVQDLSHLNAVDRIKAVESFSSRVRGLVTNGGLGASTSLLAALPNIEIVSSNGVGTDAIDLQYCFSHQIAVCNTPDVLTADVADLALCLLLDISRKVTEGDRLVRAGKWGAFTLGRALFGKNIGIIGLGRIGLAIAQRCVAFGLNVSYYGPSDKKHSDYHYVSDLCELAHNSDYLVVACPGGSSTNNLVNARVLEELGAEGYLINVSRGSVVDEDALVTALLSHKIAGAALDVFAHEPHVPQPLLSMDNVVLLPHIGSGTVETRTAMGQLVVDNLIAHFSNNPLLTQVRQ